MCCGIHRMRTGSRLRIVNRAGWYSIGDGESGMNQIVTLTGLTNRQFIDDYAREGRVGLACGTAFVNVAIARAQRHVDEEKTWGKWSHAFLFQGVRHDKHHWVVESDLEVHHRHIRLGV